MCSSSVFSQQKITVGEYINLYKDLAVEEMKKYKIPASITLAQGILESSSGNSPLAREANNHFGIKCHKEWTGKTFHQDDDEKHECFRKYKSPEESYHDHSYFLTSRDRYKGLFDLEITDYKGWAHGLKQAGYATNPRYPDLLIKIIEENGLDAYDRAATQPLADGGQAKKSPGSTVTSLESVAATAVPAVFEISGRGGNDRMIFLNNKVKFILAREGDEVYRIAKEFEIYTWQVRQYNNLKKDEPLVPGQKVYLEKKRPKSTYSRHIVTDGETMQSISQDYGVRLKILCRKNEITADKKLEAGQVILLN